MLSKQLSFLPPEPVVRRGDPARDIAEVDGVAETMGVHERVAPVVVVVCCRTASDKGIACRRIFMITTVLQTFSK